MASPEITAVVPTRDRPASLARCLDALRSQTLRGLEIVVVDDGSSRAGEVEAAVATAPGARLVRTSARGPAAARNTGVAEARGRLLLFTDDDCIPEPGWAAALAGALGDGAAAAAGITASVEDADGFAVASQLIPNSLTDSSRSLDGTAAFAASNNLGVQAELISTLRFDERYGGPGGEDRDWCARLIGAGHTIRLVPEAVVRHHQDLGLRAFWRKHAGYGRGARIFRRRQAMPEPAPDRFHLRLVRDAFRQGAGVGALVCLAQLATASGYAGEMIRERRRRAP